MIKNFILWILLKVHLAEEVQFESDGKTTLYKPSITVKQGETISIDNPLKPSRILKISILGNFILEVLGLENKGE